MATLVTGLSPVEHQTGQSISPGRTECASFRLLW